MQTHNISPVEFIQTVFPHDILLPNEAPVIAWPESFISSDTGKQVDYYRQKHPRGPVPVGEKATYFCVSTVAKQRQRQVKKRLQDVQTAFALVLDDVGSKAAWPDVPASYHLETSEGNWQVGYLLEPFDVTSPAGQAYFDSVLYSLAQAGYNDPGCRSASRLVRLPGSLHRTGFIAGLTQWEPDRIWDLEELSDAFDIPLVEPRKTQALKPGKYTDLDDVEDWVYRAMVEEGWPATYGHSDQWVYVECPWRHEHTGGLQGYSSTAYSPEDYGMAGRGFKCLHGHCANRTTLEFMEAVIQHRNGGLQS